MSSSSLISRFRPGWRHLKFGQSSPTAKRIGSPCQPALQDGRSCGSHTMREISFSPFLSSISAVRRSKMVDPTAGSTSFLPRQHRAIGEPMRRRRALQSSGTETVQTTIAALQEEMMQAAEALEFERAAFLRDQIKALKAKG